MTYHLASTENAFGVLLLALQAFQVAFLWIHDWIPLGSLNDVAAVRSQDTPRRLIIVTLIQSVPFTIGLIFSAKYFGHPYPTWLSKWLWISYGILLGGQFRAWWVPYFGKAEPSGHSVIKGCLAIRTHSCLSATGSNPIRPT